ncbi:MAG TPA: PilZ domain-containing protein [Bacteriovoracaceae bacterium]|nr:PilZ domain-containing protein [Bacteriovoracaceae bacterium]
MILKLNLQNSFDKVKFLTLLQAAFVVIGFVSEATIKQILLNFTFIFQLIILLVTFNFYYIALKNLFYSFWNISILLLLFYIFGMIRNLLFGTPIIGILYFGAMILMIIACYIISSPLYYPRFHWWEYDFRYRTDLKCMVDAEGIHSVGRISDLRRGAACLELFKAMPVGQRVQISLEILNQSYTLFAEVRSKREPIIGRAAVYGVKFINNDLEQKQRLKFLTNYWNESKRIKLRNKFALIEKT